MAKIIDNWARRKQSRSLIGQYITYGVALVAVCVGGNLMSDGLGYFVAGLLVWLELLLIGKTG